MIEVYWPSNDQSRNYRGKPFIEEQGVLVDDDWFAKAGAHIQKTSAQVTQDATCRTALIPHIVNISPLADTSGSFSVLNALLTSLINGLKG